MNKPDDPKTIVLASGNKGKIKEFSELLAPLGMQVLPQSEFGVESADETGLTFIENAILKARHASAETGLPALADDSGLAVDALGGAPGIYSARFAGAGASDADNIAKLLEHMKSVDAAKRLASFHCVLVYLRHAEDPTPIVCHGQWQGRIALQQSGSEGFGYDPIFLVPENSCTAAQLTREQKASLSHRGKATRQLLERLKVD